MHGHDMWLPRSCAEFMMKQGLQALRAYSFCARECMGMNLRLFCMRPKFHSLAHSVFELRAAVRGNHQYVLNPCIFNCEQNEDFIGRIARTSRRVSTRLTIYRTLQRYGVSFQSRLRRMRQRRRTHWTFSLVFLKKDHLNLGMTCAVFKTPVGSWLHGGLKHYFSGLSQFFVGCISIYKTDN